MKNILCFILSLFILCSVSLPAHADGLGLGALDTLSNNVTSMAKQINAASSTMMKYADMLMCNALHGQSAYRDVSATFMGVTVALQFYFPNLNTLLSGFVLYAIGFFIMLLASYYLFDVAFNISITLVILPMGFALWPFGWTRDKLKPMIESIVYYVGIFIFLPMGIYIAKLVVNIVVFQTGDFDFDTAFTEDNSEAIADNLGLFSLGFLKAVICYIVAIRVIPLMAEEFCTHFFGNSLVGSPMSEALQRGIELAKKHTVGKLAKYGADVAKSQTGKAIKSMGDKDGNILDRAIYNYGKQMSKTQKR